VATAQAFCKGLPRAVTAALGDGAAPHASATGWMVKLWFGNKELHYELGVYARRKVVELGLHFEDDAERTVYVLDVRDPGEWEEGHIKGALHEPYYFIEEWLKDEQRQNALRPYENAPLAVICGSGQRSMIACSILQAHRFAQLFNVVGGMEEWNEEGLPVV